MARIQGVSAYCICIYLRISLCLLLLITGEVKAAGSCCARIDRSMFPKDFKFGAATSAYQVEGAAREGRRLPSIWDTFSHIPGKIADGNNGDVAVDQYHRYKEDVERLKYMGMDVYRFSISWSRIFPKGSPRHGGVNQEGIAYYNNLINELLNNDIEPFITLFHWDLPQALEDEYMGFLSQKIVEDFSLYAEECFRAFGDHVKYWVTINEQLNFSYLGYDIGIDAPGRCSPGFGNCTAGDSATEPYVVGHNMLLAHSSAVKVYKTKYQGKQKGSIGIVFTADWMVPFSESSALDLMANQRAIDFRIGWYLLFYVRIKDFRIGSVPYQQDSNCLYFIWTNELSSLWHEYSDSEGRTFFVFLDKGVNERICLSELIYYWFLEPLTSGKYPDSMRKLVGARLPRFTSQEAREVKGSFDFLGYNYYTTYFTINNPHPPNPPHTDLVLDAQAKISYEVDGVYIGSVEGVSTYRPYPAGLKDLINYTKHRYNNPPIYVTETGYVDFDDGTIPLEQALDDSRRVMYHSEHLSELLEAISEGADIRGYLVWSLLDNFEWAFGYTYRFGLYYVDYKDNLKRYPKASANWFREILKQENLSSESPQRHHPL